jgi:superfamily II DNA or RNA helicase
MKLLPWQQEAFDQFKVRDKTDYVIVAGTGTGKTRCAASCAAYEQAKHKNSLILVVVPYRSIKRGWERALNDLRIATATKTQEIAADIDAIVTTYAGAGNIINRIAGEMGKRKLIIVFDEFHHMEEDNQWAAPFLYMSEDKYVCRILLSGTPWHETGELVPFIPYENDVVVHDYIHTYGQNVNLDGDGCNTVPVKFMPIRMERTLERTDMVTGLSENVIYKTEETTRSDSITPFVQFDDVTELSLRPGVLSMFASAVTELNVVRKTMHNAGGIIFVRGRNEGKAVKTLMNDHFHKPCQFVMSDDPQSHDIIKSFAGVKDDTKNFDYSRDEWIIAIDMIAEGTDIPRLKIAVDLAAKGTLMHITQRWGRVLRKDRTSVHNTFARIYHVDHAQLRYAAEKIEADMKAFKKKKGDGDGEPPPKKEYVYKHVSEEFQTKESIFKGHTIDGQIDMLASWLIDSNYGGIEADFKIAIAMARMFISTNTIPEEFFNSDKPDVVEFKPSHKQELQDLVDEYTKLTNTIAKVYFDNNYAMAGNFINKVHGVTEWKRDNKTLVQAQERLAAVRKAERLMVGKTYA